MPELTLGEKQRLFAQLLPDLLDYIHFMGYECTLGDAYRDPRAHGAQGIKFENSYGRARSAHKWRLAIDLNLFMHGEYLTETEDHKPIGEWWESRHDLCRWGGRDDDGNHYSLEHQGTS